jgi:hypothetical protein
MRDLVALAEKREAACKDEISTLLASRSTMYEAVPARPACSPAAPAPAEEQEVEAEDDGCGETMEAAAAKIDEAEKRIGLAQVCMTAAVPGRCRTLANLANLQLHNTIQYIMEEPPLGTSG